MSFQFGGKSTEEAQVESPGLFSVSDMNLSLALLSIRNHQLPNRLGTDDK